MTAVLCTSRTACLLTPAAIGACRTDNLFQSLEERTLTEEEQRIIEQRVRPVPASLRLAPAVALCNWRLSTAAF